MSNSISQELIAYINGLIRQKRRLLSLEFDVRTSTSDDEIRQYVFRAFTSGSISKEEHDKMISFLTERIEEKIEETDEQLVSIVEKENSVEVEEIIEKINKEIEISEEKQEEIKHTPEKPREPYFVIDITTLKRKERILLDIIDKKRFFIHKKALARKIAEEKMKIETEPQLIFIPEPISEPILETVLNIDIQKEPENTEDIFVLEPEPVVIPEPIVSAEEIIEETVVENILTPTEEETIETSFENQTIYIVRTKNITDKDTLRVLLGEKEIAKGTVGPTEPKIKIHPHLKAGFLFEPTVEERAFKAVYKIVDEIQQNT